MELEKKTVNLSQPIKEEKPITHQAKIQPVTKKEKVWFDKVRDNQHVKRIWDYLVKDVLIPSAKRTVDEGIHIATRMILYPGADNKSYDPYQNDRFGTRPLGRNTSTTVIDYTRNSRDPYARERYAAPRATIFNLDEYQFETADDCRTVISDMDDIIDRQKYVRASEYYEILGQPFSHTAFNYGWISLESTKIFQLSNGKFAIRFPKVVEIV